ncbi:MAG: exopolysaccharide biosynthesis polyprenyl glycosylphosphotransferase [Thermoanaerobaculaceae bacterium]|nr:exopolysaccharide biosynthesis polyprenyl glycosylphosphotransferase [Thermoanaerobaculaceae bacterium]MDI9620606.1 exopolysaccharide biosynthesis polyprenyl glycosylphosphotransferase [Acidobacteriota bacterium]NLH10215.1 exopolysaccharide biosynthesis polyprenyl glycosylphosphotransferase [Holophagae bacterium]HPW55250.1 exopolysaccharide biosynthesis polyprenyl glycosylphosphotransferase [Thermoanaerobaculaceae bacterium]
MPSLNPDAADRRLTGRPFGRRRWTTVAEIAALAFGDTSALVLAWTLAFHLWARPVLGQPATVYLELAPVLPLLLLAYAEGGLYPGFGLGAVTILRRVSLRTSLMFFLLAAVTFAFKLPHRHSRVTFTLAWGLALVLVPVGRFLLLAALRGRSWWGEPTLVLGSGPVAARTVRSLRGALSLGYRPVAILSLPGEAASPAIEGVPVVGEAEEAERFSAAGVRVAVLVWPSGHDGASLVGWLQRLFHHVVVVRDFEDLPVEGIEVRNLGTVFGVEFTNQLLRRRNRVLKRAVDLVLGLGGCLVTLPVVLASALAIKLSSRGPAFFSQQRVGVGGRAITIWKLRTMAPNAQRLLAEHLATDPAAREEWERSFKLSRDPRVSGRVGRFLRRFSLDELPQLWSVVLGDMSLVGPRPFPDYHLAQLPPAFCDLRAQVRPGITGLWQVMVRSEGGLAEQQRFDTYYIRNWSLWMDLYLLARTGAAVLRGRGAY